MVNEWRIMDPRERKPAIFWPKVMHCLDIPFPEFKHKAKSKSSRIFCARTHFDVQMKLFFLENENILIPLSQSTNYDDPSEM
jgi:hypothetical protein